MFLIGLILVEVAVGVFVFVNKDKAIQQVNEKLDQFVQEYDKAQSAKKIIDTFQSKVSKFKIYNTRGSQEVLLRIFFLCPGSGGIKLIAQGVVGDNESV